MSRWNAKASTLFILSCLAVIMLLIVVLPDVDLPDTAFHRGTAPILVHARATTAPATVNIATIFQLPSTEPIRRPNHEPVGLNAHPDPNFRPILLRSIRC
jgi:hypothetical protein